MTKSFVFVLTLLLSLLSVVSAQAQDSCAVPTGFSSYFVYPFGDQLYARWDDEQGVSWQVTYGVPGFDPVLNEGDSIIDAGSSVIYPGPVLPAETHFDVYVRTACGPDDFSAWLGPIDIYRELTPDSCGYNIEHACEIFPNDTCDPFFIIPPEFHQEAPFGVDMGCNTHPYTAWYMFEAPQNGEVMFELGSSSSLNVFDSDYNLVFCESVDSCGLFLSVDSIFLNLNPGERYYASTIAALFCDSGSNFFYDLPVGMCVTSNSPEILCTEPTDFEVHFEYPFGEIANGTWQGESNQYEIYYGSPDFDPYAEEGDSLIVLGSNYWSGVTFPPATHYDAYVRSKCDTLHSDWVGPVDIYRLPPPDSCGYDINHPCELVAGPLCEDYFFIPTEYHDPTLVGTSCQGYQQGAWHAFVMPSTGSVVLDFAPSTHYYTIFNDLGEEVLCFLDSCEAGGVSENIGEVSFMGNPGEEYFVLSAINLFCDAQENPFWYGAGLCVVEAPAPLSALIDSTAFYQISCLDSVPEPAIEVVGGCPPYDITQLCTVIDSGCTEIRECHYILTDSCGTVFESDFVWSVEISDNLDPEVISADLPINLFIAAGPLVLADYTEMLLVSDCNAFEIEQSPAAGDTLQLASFPAELCLDFVITDSCGNSSELNHCMIVCAEDMCQSGPSITFDTDTVVSDCGMGMPFQEPMLMSDCGIASNTFVDSLSQASCPVIWSRTHWVTDSCGTTASAMQWLILNESDFDFPPCPDPVTVEGVGMTGSNPFMLEDFDYVSSCGFSHEVELNPEPSTFLDLGYHEVVATVTDVCGNTSICTTGVTVLPQSLILANPMGGAFECDEDIPPFGAVMQGGCPPYDYEVTESLTSNDPCELIYEVSGVISDQCGQEQVIDYSYSIVDSTGPIVQCPQTDTLYTSDGTAAQPFDYNDAVINDNCSAIGDFTISPPSFDLLPVGSYSLSYVVFDVCGNQGECETTLVVASVVGIAESYFEEITISQSAAQLRIGYPVELAGYRARLMDLTGKEVGATVLNDEPALIDLQGLSAGAYVLSFSDGEQMVYSRRVMVE